MREIKFRGKRIDNGEWVYGDLIWANYLPIRAWVSSIYDGTRLRSMDTADKTATFRAFEVIPETVGQYTGLKDDNGREIFEGDILKLQLVGDEYHKTVRVEFGNPNCAYDWGYQIVPFGNFPYRKDILLWIETETDRVKVNVIGNITDNPELIKGE